MSVTTSSIKKKSLPALIFIHFKYLLTKNFALVNLKWFGLVLIFIHLGFLGMHRFMVKRFAGGITMLLLFCLGIGIFYLPITGFWMYITQGVGVIALSIWFLLYIMDFFNIILGEFGHEENDKIETQFGVFVESIARVLVVIYFEYIGLHFLEIPYLPKLMEPAWQSFTAVASFITNIF